MTEELRSRWKRKRKQFVPLLIRKTDFTRATNYNPLVAVEVREASQIVTATSWFQYCGSIITSIKINRKLRIIRF